MPTWCKPQISISFAQQKHKYDTSIKSITHSTTQQHTHRGNTDTYTLTCDHKKDIKPRCRVVRSPSYSTSTVVHHSPHSTKIELQLKLILRFEITIKTSPLKVNSTHMPTWCRPQISISFAQQKPWQQQQHTPENTSMTQHNTAAHNITEVTQR